MATIRREEPDQVPVSPRTGAYLIWKYGRGGLEQEMQAFPEMAPMHIIGDMTPNYIYSYPNEYDLPEVKVTQTRYQEAEYEVVERTFHTPAGALSDRTKIPPSGREYGVSPNPIKTEYLVKGLDDLAALRYVMARPRADAQALKHYADMLDGRGVVMVCLRSPLDHQAGDCRDMQDLMMDYYLNRELFDRLLGMWHEHVMAQTKATLEAGAEWIFGSWYYTSLSAGWSPAIFEEVFVPQIREHVELVHSYGAYYDYYDDGKLAATMELIADCGVDVLETCTPPPVGDFDLRQAKAAIGRKTTLKGYVDLLYVIQRGTPELVEQTVREAMEIGKPGGGFILGSSDSFRENTPNENLEAYWRACRECGKY